MRIATGSLILTLFIVAEGAPGAPEKALSITFVDTEGGAATLIVTPSGESVLIDSGYPGDRDADRILRAAREAGLSRIDHYITTHWHIDHVGGIGTLAKKIKVEKFYDHGLPPAANDGGTDPALIEIYEKISTGRQVLHAGDSIPLSIKAGAPALSLKCLVSSSMIEGGAAAAQGAVVCTRHPARAADLTDNARSLGFLLRFGDFEFLDLGDLTWNIEHALVCPRDRIGKVDVYQVTHHGQDSSNHPLLVEAAAPRVAVMNNGPKKGGAPAVYNILKEAGVEAIFQLHRNLATSDKENAPPECIANPSDPCQGEPVAIEVAPDAKTYSVKVGRAGAPRSFATR